MGPVFIYLTNINKISNFKLCEIYLKILFQFKSKSNDAFKKSNIHLFIFG